MGKPALSRATWAAAGLLLEEQQSFPVSLFKVPFELAVLQQFSSPQPTLVSLFLGVCSEARSVAVVTAGLGVAVAATSACSVASVVGTGASETFVVLELCFPEIA